MHVSLMLEVVHALSATESGERNGTLLLGNWLSTVRVYQKSWTLDEQMGAQAKRSQLGLPGQRVDKKAVGAIMAAASTMTDQVTGRTSLTNCRK